MTVSLKKNLRRHVLVRFRKVVLRQHLSQHRLLPCAYVSEHKARKVLGVIEPSGQDQDHCRGDYSEMPHPAAKGDKGRSKGQKSPQFRFYSGKCFHLKIYYFCTE